MNDLVTNRIQIMRLFLTYDPRELHEESLWLHARLSRRLTSGRTPRFHCHRLSSLQVMATVFFEHDYLPSPDFYAVLHSIFRSLGY